MLDLLPDSFYVNNIKSLPNLRKEYQELDDLTLLRIAKRQLLELINQVQNKPRPNYDVDGQNIKWQDYLDSLYDKLKRINDLIAIEEGPIEEVTLGWT